MMGLPLARRCRRHSNSTDRGKAALGYDKAARAAYLFLAMSGAAPTSAFAHGSERGFVLLLPTGHYLAAGAAAVAASFVLLAFVPAGAFSRWMAKRVALGTIAAPDPTPTSLLSLFLLAFLVATGFFGIRDPLQNLLPLTIWTLWWVGLTLLHALFGNLWALLNPWSGACRLAVGIAGGRTVRMRYPDWLGYWPAVLFFLGFAWFELVHPAPDDPAVLAKAVLCYWVAAFAGMLIFGEASWTEKAEPFSIFFRLVAGLSPLILEKAGHRRRKVALAIPGVQLAARAPLPPSGVLFVILTLSSVSFDGLSRTFFWLDLAGVNPLEYPGRTALVGRNTGGLLLGFALLAAVYWLAVRLGWIAAGMRRPLAPIAGALVLSLIPISLGFHFAHYLTVLLVNGQYALAALSDPLANGADLFGTARRHVTTSFLNTYDGVLLIWNLQTAAIVIAHVVGIVLAHVLALRYFGEGRGAWLSELPLAALMVLYTLFGLWLLSTPSI